MFDAWQCTTGATKRYCTFYEEPDVTWENLRLYFLFSVFCPFFMFFILCFLCSRFCSGPLDLKGRGHTYHGIGAGPNLGKPFLQVDCMSCHQRDVTILVLASRASRWTTCSSRRSTVSSRWSTVSSRWTTCSRASRWTTCSRASRWTIGS